MSPQVYVIKGSGERELFDEEKLRQSLSRIGASGKEIDQVVSHVGRELSDGITTDAIYRHAYVVLRRLKNPTALGRYSLRRALFQLGPTGFPFEKFLGKLFRTWGYESITNQMLLGRCVAHEVDLVAWNDAKLIMVESKFHNQVGQKTDLKVILYIKARFDDLIEQTFEYGKRRTLDEGWLVTNTKFTSNAIQYGECAGVKMIGWNYPKKGNLQQRIEDSGLHPITCLTTLSEKHKQLLLGSGMILCKDVVDSRKELSRIGLSEKDAASVLSEAHSVCSV